MYVYTLTRGVREGYLPAEYRAIAETGSVGIWKRFVVTGLDTVKMLHGTVSVSELGGYPYRDGSYAYYTGEEVVDNDPKVLEAVLLAAVAVDELKTSTDQGHKTVILDYYFNNERRKDITGVPIRYHYTWEDRANSGFALWGHLFRQYGAHTDSLPVAPAAENLKKGAVYIIVDPDDDRGASFLSYVLRRSGVIGDWVKAGRLTVFDEQCSAANAGLSISMCWRQRLASNSILTIIIK